MAKRDKQLRIDTLSTNPTSVVSLVGSTVSVHSITQHTGTLLDWQAPQFLKKDGSRDLEGNLAVADGITIDGVDLSAHAANADAHHKTATQSDGITIDADQVVGVRLAAVAGLEFNGSGDLMLADGVAGAGISISSKVLAVDLASPSGLGFNVGGQLQLADSVAGVGLSIASKVLSVKKATTSGLAFDGTNALMVDDSIAGNGLSITSKVLRVNEGYQFNWTATHTFDSDTLVVSAEQDAVWVNSGTPDGSAAFKVTPAAVNDFGIYLKQLSGQTASLMRVEDSSGSALLTLTGGGSLQSGTPAFVSGLVGWEIAPDGTAEFNNVFVRGELHATIFVADEMHAQSGTQVIATATKVANPISGTDNVVSAMNDTFTLVVQASWDTGLCYFANNHILVVKTMVMENGGIDIYEIYMVVTGTPTSNNDRDLDNGKPGTYDVVVTRRYGGATGLTIPAGAAVVKWGQVGGSAGTYTGAILLTSDLNHAPYMDVFTVAADVSGSATWSAPPTIVPRVREGLLSGVLGLGTEWGIAMGTDLSDSSLSARYVVVSDQRVKLQNVDQTVYQSNHPRISLAATGNVKFGTDIDASATTTFDFVALTGELRIGPGSGGPSLQWTGSALEVRDASANAVITLDSSGDSYFSGVMTIGSDGEIRQGSGSLSSDYTGLRIWRSGDVGLIAGYNANAIQWQGDSDGKLKAGAGTVMLSANGVDLEAYTGSNPNPTENVKSLTFWSDLGDVGTSTKPSGRIWGADDVSGQYGVQIEAFHPTETATYPKLWVSYDSLGYKRNMVATDFDNILLTAAEMLYLTAPTTITGNVTIAGHYIPSASITYDIGSASKTVRKLYVSEIIADTITGGTQITGSIWQYDSGDMYVRSNSSSTRTLYVANPGAGTMHLDVEGNIIVGGSVDGVDVAGLGSSFTAHTADANAHHNKQHVLATTSALGGDHTVSGLTSGQVLRATGATTAAFGSLLWSEVNKTTSSIADITSRSHSLLTGIGANDHHNQQHSITGSDHTVVGSAMDVVGLTGTNTLGVLATSSAPTGAAILKSTSVGALTLQGLTVSSDADATIILGRTKVFAVATDNATLAHIDHASGTNYGWRQVASGAVVHNAPTGQNISHRINNADVMVMSASGLDISAGNLTVTSGQDFIVGSNLLLVDGSQGNVGINCEPDPQFDLDVGGNLRAQGWIVGKHAIQLKDARMILHFDGPEPYSTNEGGELNGHMGQVGTANSVVVFRPGKFGKAVEVAASANNICSNPQFDSGSTSGWSNYSFGGGAGTRATTTTRNYVGAYSYKITKTDGVTTARFGASFARSINSGQAISFSVMVRIEGAAGGTPVARFHIDGSFTATTLETTSVTDEWVMLSGTATSNASTTTNVYVWLEGCATGVLYFTDLQITATAYVVPYTSSSRASNGSLYYPSGTLSGNKGTVMLWFRAPWGQTPTALSSAIMLSSGYDSFSLRKKSSSNQIAFRNGSADAISYTYSGWDRGWHHLALTYSAETNTSTLYIDGVSVATGTFVEFTPSALYVGCPSTNVDLWNGWIDEFSTVNRVLLDSEVLAIYQSDAPIFAETSVFNFRVANNLVWADTEGLWMLDASGNAVLGVSGVDSKSWGGRTLNVGDFSLGKYGASNGGWFLFDQIDTSSKPSLTMGYGTTEAFRFDASGNKITGALTVSGSLLAGVATIDANGVGMAVDSSFAWSTAAGFWNTTVTTGRSYKFTGATGNNFLGMTGNYASSTSTLALVNENETASGASKNSRIVIDARSITDDAISSVGTSSIYLAASQWAPNQGGVVNVAKISMTVANASSIDITLDSKTAEIKGGLKYMVLAQQSSIPSVYGSANTQATVLFKGTKLIVIYDDSGTTRYKYLDLAGTGVTWVHTTTAP